MVIIAYMANCVSASTCCNCSYKFIATTLVWSTKWAFSCSTRIYLMGQNKLKGANNSTLDKETNWFTMFIFFSCLHMANNGWVFQKGGMKCETHHPLLHMNISFTRNLLFFACRLRSSFVFKLPLFKFSHHF
jgi:hypothetical protein